MGPVRGFCKGTHNIHTLIIGERVTGIPAYKYERGLLHALEPCTYFRTGSAWSMEKALRTRLISATSAWPEMGFET